MFPKNFHEIVPGSPGHPTGLYAGPLVSNFLYSPRKFVKMKYKLTQKEKKKAPRGFEPLISCLLDRRFNQLSHGATCQSLATITHVNFRVITCRIRKFFMF